MKEMTFETEVKPFGNSAHITVDKLFLGKTVRVHIEVIDE